MTAGANYKLKDGRVQFWEPLVTGDELITQDHEARFHARQASYLPELEYGNPFVDTLSNDTISETEVDMRLIAETKECSLQDARIVDAVVDPSSIERTKTRLDFKYELFKRDGGSIQQEFSS
jgi:hypothetical protein